MKNYYEILQINENATASQIKKAYRNLALNKHPDKGGDPEEFKAIVEANEILSDPEKKLVYDNEWSIFKEDIFKYNPNRPIAGYLTTKTFSYSKTFKDQHARLVTKFKKTPADAINVNCFLKPFIFDYYENYAINNYQEKYSDLNSLIIHKSNGNTQKVVTPVFVKLTPQVMVNLLKDFLEGNYFGEVLAGVIKKVSNLLQEIKAQEPNSTEILLYEAILEIMSYSKKQHSNNYLINCIEKITDFAKSDYDNSNIYLADLFQNRYYRNLVSQALHLYWMNQDDCISLQSLNGLSSADELVEKFKNLLTTNRESKNSNEGVTKGLRYARLLANFEKNIHEVPDEKSLENAKFYRDKAYAILEWMPALLLTSQQAIILNTFMEAGICFQKAASYEHSPEVVMADEEMAFYLYQTATTRSRNITPDIEFYFLVHCLKYIARFKYNLGSLKNVIQAFQHRTLKIANVFPFFQAARSNVAIYKDEHENLKLMRNLLQNLNRLLESNVMKIEKNENDLYTMDHEYVTVLYQVYEACLENWYDKKFDPEFEKSIRLKLMTELLAINSWTFFDLDLNLDSPWMMIDRDKAGWMRPTRALPYSDVEKSKNYSAINGVEFNYETGELSFAFTSWKKDEDLDYDNLISLYDISELFEAKITSAIFSLDPPDPDMAYHPFNKMRFEPSRLCQTQLFHSMLLTDYLLKFFTIGQEVQGRYPYGMKSLNDLTKKMPAYLKSIIEDYQAAPKTHSLHRFWIEAGEVSVAAEEIKENVIQYALDDIKMVVKKHKMVRDVNGNLVDTGNEDADEGWDFYVLTPAQKLKMEQSDLSSIKPAIIFIENTNHFYFIENEEFSLMNTLNHCDHLLKRLTKQKRDTTQKVEKTPKNQELIYWITREAAKQTGKSRRYSPEYVFAQDFTIHYDAFAQYFPEFGRLRELSKAVSLIRIMESQRNQNDDAIEKLNKALSDKKSLDDMRAKINAQIDKLLKDQFNELSMKYSKSAITEDQAKVLDDLDDQIGNMSFDRNSPEIKEICNQANEGYKSQVIRQGGYAAWNMQSSQVWSKYIEPEIPKWISQVTSQKYKSCMAQLQKVFEKALSGYFNAEDILKAFLDGDKTQLLKVLIEYQQKQIHKELKEVFPYQSTAKIALALNGNIQSVNEIIAHRVNVEVEKQKEYLRNEMAKKKRMQLSYDKIGFSKESGDIDLTNICHWVPASIKHDAEGGRSQLIYGGVSVNPKMSFLTPGTSPSQQLVNNTFLHQSQVKISGAQISNNNQPATGGGSGAGGYTGGGGGNNSGNNYDAHNRVQHEAMKAQLRENMQKPIVQDPRLQKYINEIYRPNSVVGSGSTAAAIRNELETGSSTKGCYHSKKGQEQILNLERWFANNSQATPGDRAAVENIIHDLRDALKHTQRPNPRR